MARNIERKSAWQLSSSELSNTSLATSLSSTTNYQQSPGQIVNLVNVRSRSMSVLTDATYNEKPTATFRTRTVSSGIASIKIPSESNDNAIIGSESKLSFSNNVSNNDYININVTDSKNTRRVLPIINARQWNGRIFSMLNHYKRILH